MLGEAAVARDPRVTPAARHAQLIAAPAARLRGAGAEGQGRGPSMTAEFGAAHGSARDRAPCRPCLPSPLRRRSGSDRAEAPDAGRRQVQYLREQSIVRSAASVLYQALLVRTFGLAYTYRVRRPNQSHRQQLRANSHDPTNTWPDRSALRLSAEGWCARTSRPHAGPRRDRQAAWG